MHKFGGTSVASAECFVGVKKIIEENLMSPRVNLAVVVSAMGGKPKVTDLLLNAVAAAAQQDDVAMSSLLTEVKKKHLVALDELETLDSETRKSIGAQIERDLVDVENLLRAVKVMQSATPQIAELVSGFGETWSARVLTALLRASGHDFVYVDARDVLRVEGGCPHDRCGAVEWDESKAHLNQLLDKLRQERLLIGPSTSSSTPSLLLGEASNLLPPGPPASPKRRAARNGSPKHRRHEGGAQLVITGYIASTVDGAPTTLKRDGSDYSASIFGKLLNATEVHIWTDVDGVLSADPRRVPEAFSLDEVTYEEAMELAYFGAKVLHPKTMTPAVEANIPLFIRNTFNPRGRGTRIGKASELRRKTMMAGFTTVDDVAVINVCGTGMLGVPGVVFAAAGALKTAEISVRLIAQASSEMSIALAVDNARADEAKELLTAAYEKELRSGEIAAVDVVRPCSIIAAVAQTLSNDAPGRFYDALGRCGIPLVCAAQGCDERNLSAVVHQKDARRALRAVHSAFLSHNVVALALVGVGFVGGHLLDAIAEAERMLMARFNVRLRVCALVNADVMALAEPDETLMTSLGGEPDIDLADWRTRLTNATLKSDFEGLIGHLLRYRSWVPDIVVVDASYSLAVAEQHATWLKHQFHVVNANTRALAGPLDLFEQILLARDAAGAVCYFSESCVGGGLPVIDTLRNLVLGGDTVRHVECVISASMSFIFSLLSPAWAAAGNSARDDDDEPRVPPPSFKDAVKTAWIMGLLENEPFLDLSGQDAATKLLALGRELGLALEPQHILAEAVDGLNTLLTDTTRKPTSIHARNFRRQYLLWRCGSRASFEMGGTDDEIPLPPGPNELSQKSLKVVAETYSADKGALPLMMSSSSSSDLFGSWDTPESHERAMNLVGGNVEASAPAPTINGKTRVPRGDANNGTPRLFGWSAVESYDAKSLETGYSRSEEESGRPMPIDPQVLDAIDKAMTKRIRQAHANGKVLRHVGRIDVATGDVAVRLEEVSPNHAFAQLTGPELCVRFFTERYRAIPLTVNGPLFAAGMASGVFSELLRVVRHCSGHDRPYHLQLRRTRSMSRIANLNIHT